MAAGEYYTAHYARTGGLECVAFRYGTVYGPGMLGASEAGAFVRERLVSALAPGKDLLRVTVP
jgi:nucleoside-diphosphate-sugar epimerase